MENNPENSSHRDMKKEEVIVKKVDLGLGRPINMIVNYRNGD